MQDKIFILPSRKPPEIEQGFISNLPTQLTSLIGREQEGDEPRLMMLETLREFGLECLAASSGMEVTRQAHADYYLALVEEAETKLGGPEQAAWLERLEQEYDNLRAAVQWLLERQEAGYSMEMALRLGGALRRFWLVRGYAAA